MSTVDDEEKANHLFGARGGLPATVRAMKRQPCVPTVAKHCLQHHVQILDLLRNRNSGVNMIRGAHSSIANKVLAGPPNLDLRPFM